MSKPTRNVMEFDSGLQSTSFGRMRPLRDRRFLKASRAFFGAANRILLVAVVGLFLLMLVQLVYLTYFADLEHDLVSDGTRFSCQIP